MITGLPDTVAWPLLFFMTAVTIARFAFYSTNTTQYDKYLNYTLGFALASNLLRDRTIETYLNQALGWDLTTMQQVSLALMIFVGAEFLGFTTVWRGDLSKDEAIRRHRRQRIVAVFCCVVFLVAATPARNAGEHLEVHGGWLAVIAWAFYEIPIVALTAPLMWMCVKETIRRDADFKERLVPIGGIVIGLLIAVSNPGAAVLALLEELGWLHSVDYRLAVHSVIFFIISVFANGLAAVPCLMAVHMRSGLDSMSRTWRQLQPMLTDMTRIVPGIAFQLYEPSSYRRKKPLDVHQSVVQLRDAMLQLRPWERPIDTDDATQFLQQHAVPPRRHPEALRALSLARAAEAKRTGAPVADNDETEVTTYRCTSLQEEATDLLRLAAWWPAARTFTSSGHPMEATP
ncbi:MULTISPECIES: DUF6545 domain-containing protein [Mycobacteriaceae]|uniref:DUF6545 domain-containing protein n=1 Tax=Mycolicibacterium senegalense TaxID=1796 RepID=A0ABR5FMB8_9MYCO|nr:MULTISPECIES: DUF6545 domain-containing protein [Mycolicibacterium]KLI09253.1 hypothetical protein AA982_04070 [Mycolicibacterium senegalense]KLO47645.1 hypothetical protein ABW05_31090 [Mycolicibacterium senegalense]OMB76659.1 hypothetical protein A5741_31805 [Mycolicibacterium conceptionense]